MRRFTFTSPSLRTRLIFLVLLCVLPALGLTVYTDLEDRRLEIDQTRENVLRLTRLAAAREEQLIEGTRQLLVVLAELPEVRDERSICSKRFGQLLKHYPSYANVVAVDLDGDVFCSGVPLTKPVNLADRAWFQRVIKVRNFTVGNYQIGRISGKPGVAFSYPVLDDKGQVQSVVYTLLDLAWLNQLAAKVHLPPGAALHVIDRDGTILARHPDGEKWVGKLVSDAPIIKAMLAEGEGIREVGGLDGVLRLYAFTRVSKVEEIDLYMAIGIRRDDPFADANRHLTRNLTWLGLVTLLALATAWGGIEKFLVHPMKLLVKTTKQLAAGDLSVRTGLSYGSGEIGQLAAAFDQMVEVLKQRNLQLETQAFYDPLTNLPNRTLFMDRVEYALRRMQRHKDYVFAILFLDVDRFKMVNDTLGHLEGDQLLIAIARRLESCVCPEDTIARLGGDEFIILLEAPQNVNSVTDVAERIQEQLTQPFNLDRREVVTTASIGIALSTSSYERPEDLLRDADIAMYCAKARGRSNYDVFDTVIHNRIRNRWQLETDLRQAIERQEFQLFYQPIIFLASGRIVGFEALLYWNHSVRGLVSPAEFIPVAEETGLINPIGQWVLREACSQMATWQKQFRVNPPLTISVNLSGKQFSQTHLLGQIQQILQETGLQANTLMLEITESVIMENAESDGEKLLQLKDLGTQLHIDDFGTGYSSLSRLQSFPIDALKIDRSFVSRMTTDSGNAEIIRAIVMLDHNLKLDVVAEGVESADQVAQLGQLGCEYVQGYFFSRPVHSQAAGALIALLPAQPE